MSQQQPIVISSTESSPTLVNVELLEVDRHDENPHPNVRPEDLIDVWIRTNSNLTPYQIHTFVHNVGMMLRHVMNVLEVNEGLVQEVKEVSISIVVE